jgi:hypothetical protein
MKRPNFNLRRARRKRHYLTKSPISQMREFFDWKPHDRILAGRPPPERESVERPE